MSDIINAIPIELLSIILHESCLVRGVIDISLLLVCRRWNKMLYNQRKELTLRRFEQKLQGITTINNLNDFWKETIKCNYYNGKVFRPTLIPHMFNAEALMRDRDYNIRRDIFTKKVNNAAEYVATDPTIRDALKKIEDSPVDQFKLGEIMIYTDKSLKSRILVKSYNGNYSSVIKINFTYVKEEPCYWKHIIKCATGMYIDHITFAKFIDML